MYFHHILVLVSSLFILTLVSTLCKKFTIDPSVKFMLQKKTKKSKLTVCHIN